MPPVSSLDAFHASEMVLPVCVGDRRLPGTLGGVWSLEGFVVAVASLLSCEEFPAASRATSVKTNWVPGVSLVTVAFSAVPPTLSMNWPCLKTSYSATPTLSVDLFHASETVVSVTPVTWLFVGGEGGRVSAARAGLALATSPTPSAASAPATINFRRSLGTTELLLRSTGTGGVAATGVLALAKDGRAGLQTTENVCYRYDIWSTRRQRAPSTFIPVDGVRAESARGTRLPGQIQRLPSHMRASHCWYVMFSPV